jgi:hypothetical protein
MSVPPHSVQPRPAAAERVTFTERNNFLYLLLGLVATSEGVLQLIPGFAPDASRIAQSDDVPDKPNESEPLDPRSLLR